MEIFLLIALGASWVYLIAQSVMLDKFAKRIKELEPPF